MCACKQPHNLKHKQIKSDISRNSTHKGNSKCMKQCFQVCDMLDTQRKQKIMGKSCNIESIEFIITCLIGLLRSAVESILLYGLECLPLILTLQDKLDSAYRRILRYALGVHFPVCISNAELARRTRATALSKTLCQRRLRLVGHALRMANPSPLTILLRFLQPGLRRRRGHARTLTLHQNIIDDISAINQSVKSITSASSSYFGRIVATLSTN